MSGRTASARGLARALGAAGALTAALLARCGAMGDDTVAVLADVEGWDPGLEELLADEVWPENAVLEIAYDEAAVEQLLDLAVPVGEDAGRGDGEVVDLDREVLALWSSGQSGTCPETVRSVRRSGDLVVLTVDLDGRKSDCQDDWHPYREIMVLDRAQVPDRRALGSATAELRHGHTEAVLPVRLRDIVERP